MRIKGAMTVLKNRCEFFGFSFEQLIDFIQKNPLAQDMKTLEAYEVYKKEMA